MPVDIHGYRWISVDYIDIHAWRCIDMSSLLMDQRVMGRALYLFASVRQHLQLHRWFVFAQAIFECPLKKGIYRGIYRGSMEQLD